MKKHLLFILALLCFFSSSAQVTRIWTDYNSFWTSSSAAINPVNPNNAHNLLAFRWNGTNYSTAVNNAKLTANGVTFSPTKFRALPINDVPLTSTGTAYFVGLGALVDGLPTSVDNGPINPFKPLTTGAQKAAFLTKGIQGLDLGSCLANIPNTTPIRFNLSANGITLSNINDGIPDIFVTQVAAASSNADTFRFVNSNGVTVGNVVTVNLDNNTTCPVVANWTVDFYNNDSTQNMLGFVNTPRPMRFFAADLTAFGITSSNYTQAVALLYTPTGDSDPAFLAFNEPSLGIATQLTVTAQPTTSACNGTMPSNFTVQLRDRLGAVVLQSGIEITATMETGPGNLLGTVTATTNTNGVATFTDLSFEVGGNHTIRFSNSSLEAAITANIVGASNCDAIIWTGNGANSNWNNTANWQTAVIPNANNDVVIPTGRPRYPVLQNNAGAKNITLGVNTTITLNGKVFAIAGTITKDVTAKIIGSIDDSVLYMSGSATQTIPSGLILNGALANLTIENAAGVTNADGLKIAQILLVRTGTFATGGLVEMICRFLPTRRTGQIGPIGANGFITGNVTVEQCFPARRAFRFVTSSVTTSNSIRANWQENAAAWNADPKPGYGTHITGLGAAGSVSNDGINGFDWQPSGNPSLFSFNNTTQNWSAVTATTGTLTAGVPYRMLIRGNRSTNIQFNASAPSNTILRSTGTIVKGPISVSGLSSINNSFNLVGNPFQSIVDMTLVNGVATNVKPFYYVYDPTLGGTPIVGQPGGRGAFVAVNTLTGTTSNALSQASIYLQPYQAFYIQTNNSGSTPQITFKESDKATSRLQTNVFRSANEENTISNQFIDLTLFNQSAFDANDTPSDGFRVDFSADANNEVDDFDAVKFINLDENISRKVGESLISMENRNLPENGALLPLHIAQYTSSAYKMRINTSDFPNQNVYLKDYYTNQDFLLESNAISTYSFTVSAADPASKNENRFAFSVLESQLGIDKSTFESAFNLYPNPTQGGSIFLNAKLSFTNAQIEIYNLLGQKVVQLKADFGSNNQLHIPISNLSLGVYILNVKTNTGEHYTSKFIKN